MARPVTADTRRRPGGSLIDPKYLRGCISRGLSVTQMAHRLGLTVAVVERELRKHGLWEQYAQVRQRATEGQQPPAADAEGETVAEEDEAGTPDPPAGAPNGPGPDIPSAGLLLPEDLTWYQPTSQRQEQRTVTLRRTVTISQALKADVGAPCLVRPALSADRRWFVPATVPEKTRGAFKLRADRSSLADGVRDWLRKAGIPDGTYPATVERRGEQRWIVVDLQRGRKP